MGILSILYGNQNMISSDYTPQINYYPKHVFCGPR